MNKLFEPGDINGMKLANRFVRSATWEGMAAEDGSVTTRLVEKMAELAKGGVGLIISGHAYTLPQGQAGPWQMGIYKDELIDGLKAMVDAVHAAGGKIVAQLAHAGAFARKEIIKQAPHVVSNFDGLSTSPRYELTQEDIHKLVHAFADAARRARVAWRGARAGSGNRHSLLGGRDPSFNR